MKRPPWPLFLEVLPLLSPTSRAVTKRHTLLSSGVTRTWQRHLHATRPLATSLFDEPTERRASSSVKWTKYEDGVLPLWIADMDFRSPQCIIDAIKARADDGIFGYTYPPPELKEAVVDYLARVHNWKVDPSWIVFLHGLVPGLAVASRMAGSEGDEVMVNTPVYPPFLWTPRTAGMRVLSVPLRFEEGMQEWVMDYDAMEALVTSKTRMFVLCNPHNPVGKVFSSEELRRLGEFCKRHDLVLCSDEIHCDLVLSEERRHTPLAALQDPALLARSITLHAPSKTYNVPGLCCSYAVIPDDALRHRFKKAARGFVTEINCMGYEACTAAYTHGEPWRLQLIKYLRDNRDFATAFINKNIPGLRTYPGLDATYLMWLDATPLLEKLPRGSDPATFFLEKAKVALSDGRDFSGSGHVRLNFGCPRSVLRDALERMAEAVRPLYPGQ